MKRRFKLKTGAYFFCKHETIMKRTIFIFIAVLLFCNIYVSGAQYIIGNVLIETGYSDKDMRSFLESSAVKYDKYFSKIYGENNNRHIIIKLYSRGQNLTFEEIKNKGYSFAAELVLAYPSYSMEISVFPSSADKSWHVIRWEIEAGQITTFQEN